MLRDVLESIGNTRLLPLRTIVPASGARILLKLGLRDRVQAVIFAYESGLTRPGGSPDA